MRIRELATKLADAMRTGESPTELAQSRDTRDENVASAYDFTGRVDERWVIHGNAFFVIRDRECIDATYPISFERVA